MDVDKSILKEDATTGQRLDFIHGRGFSAKTDFELYVQPVDGEEHSRLDRQHELVKLIMGGLYPAAIAKEVQAALAPKPDGIRPAVLDIGTGSGIWAIDMATEFSHADVLGVDLVTPSEPSPERIPPNCRFEIADANKDLNRYTGMFDVVQCRCIEPGIIDFDLLMYEIAECLRPGGVMIVITLWIHPVDNQGQPALTKSHDDLGCTAYQKLIDNVLDCMSQRGRLRVRFPYWSRWVADNANFKEVNATSVFCPNSPWQKDADPKTKRIAELMRDNTINLVPSLAPLLLSAGYDKGVVDEWVKETTEEIKTEKVCAFIWWFWVTAIRTDAPYVPRTGPPPPQALGVKKFNEPYQE